MGCDGVRWSGVEYKVCVVCGTDYGGEEKAREECVKEK